MMYECDRGIRRLALLSRVKRYGWTTLDSQPGADIQATIPPLPTAVRTEQWDVIELIHGIEHFYVWEARQLLCECRQALVPGGQLILEQPDIEYAARVLLGILKRPVAQHAMWALYGDPSHRREGMCHRWGWTPDTLVAALREAGFARVEIQAARHHVPERDFRVIAVTQPGCTP